MRTRIRRAPSSTWSVLGITFGASALLSTLWALASPIYSVPDENAHVAKAVSQAHGQLIGDTVTGIEFIVVQLPDEYAYSPQSVCFVRNAHLPADCASEPGAAGGTDWFNTWVGSYNPIYYYLVGWPSLIFGGSTGIYAMRIVSALLSAIFLGWAYQAGLAARSARWMPLGLAFLVSPMIVYFAGSVNPQGLEITSAAALWMGLLRLLQTWGSPGEVLLKRWYLWVIVIVSAAMLANARATGPLWVVVVVGLCLLVSGWKPTKALFTTPNSYMWMAVLAVAGLFSVGWTLSSGSLSGQAEGSDAPLVHAGFFQGFWYMIRQLPAFAQQAAGFFGWFDTPLPAFAYPLFYVAFSMLTLLALTATGRREWRVLLAIIAAAALVPAFVQGYSVGQTGIIWQGRYGLFLYIGIALVAAWLLSGPAGGRVAFLSLRLTSVLVPILAVYGIAAFVLVLRRYVVGLDRPITAMLSDPEWQPPLGWIPLTAVFAGTMVCFAVWMLRRAASAGAPLLSEDA